MTLRDVECSFITSVPNGYGYVESITQADGITMLCPECFRRNNGPVGTHHVICWSPKIGQDVTPTGGRWEMHGTSLDDLTLVAGLSSVVLNETECRAHFYVRGGQIVFA